MNVYMLIVCTYVFVRRDLGVVMFSELRNQDGLAKGHSSWTAEARGAKCSRRCCDSVGCELILDFNLNGSNNYCIIFINVYF